jgi:hypothetical protein
MSLREKAIAAYEASDLQQRDTERKKALINEIAHFFHGMPISVVINDNPFKFDGLIFYASELRMGSGKLFGYEVNVSRRCDACQEYIELTAQERFIDNENLIENSKVDLVQFGRWLLEPHLCEFSFDKRKPVEGFGRRTRMDE